MYGYISSIPFSGKLSGEETFAFRCVCVCVCVCVRVCVCVCPANYHVVGVAANFCGENFHGRF